VDRRHGGDHRAAHPDESYQNFPNRRIENWQQQYDAENWDRLVEVKTRCDRHDLVHNPQSIPPWKPPRPDTADRTNAVDRTPLTRQQDHDRLRDHKGR
jgi:hypothetical protein